MVPIAGLALLASQGSLQPSPVGAVTCVSTPDGTAVLYDPGVPVTGTVDAAGCGNGIVVDGGHTATISHATIFGAEDTGGGDGDGIHLDGSGTVTVQSSTIRDNVGDGVDATNSSNLVMTGTQVKDNQSRGMQIDTDATATIDASSIAGVTNTGSEGDGDGIRLGEDVSDGGSGLVTITRSIVSNNVDGGIDDHWGSELVMLRDSLSNNGGTGVDIAEGSDATINSSLITGTTDTGVEGGELDGDGVHADGSGDVTIAGSQINGNSDDGVDLVSSDATFVLRADVMKGNKNNGLYVEDTTVTSSASIFLMNDDGIYVSSGAFVTLTDAVVQQNVFDGIYVTFDSHGLTMTNGFVLANNRGLESEAQSPYSTTVARSVLCRNKSWDLDADGPFFPDHRTQICHSV
jgi:hypothetical protein